jgi:hypothetical protein
MVLAIQELDTVQEGGQEVSRYNQKESWVCMAPQPVPGSVYTQIWVEGMLTK